MYFIAFPIQWIRKNGEEKPQSNKKMSDAPAAKKIKTTPDPPPPPLYSDLDLSTKLTIEGTPQGSSEIKHATVKYASERLSFQLEALTGSLRCPFGIDDGLKFNGKPSLNIELPTEQCAFFQGELEAKVKDAAVEHKANWFGAIKPLPSDDDVRKGFNSRVKVDDEGKYPATLKVNVCLAEGPKKVKVQTSRRLTATKITKRQPADADAVGRGSRVVPVLRTAGGVWISVNAKKKTLEYGLVFEAFELLVIEETEAGSSFNLGGVEEASDDETEANKGPDMGPDQFD